MIDPAKVALFIPNNLKRFKLALFERIGQRIREKGGRVVKHNAEELRNLPADVIPIVGCQPETTQLIAEWRTSKRTWCYWDRGYWRRWFATSTPKPASIEESYYRFHLNGFQMQSIGNVPDDRWRALKLNPRPWVKAGRHIVIAAPPKPYVKFHRIEGWLEETLDAIARITDRQLVIRHKEQVLTRPLTHDLDGAHCLVTHGSIAAVESVYYGCPVFVHPDSAAALMGRTDIKQIEKPVYPERDAWFRALAYSQWNEHELVNGALWRMLS